MILHDDTAADYDEGGGNSDGGHDVDVDDEKEDKPLVPSLTCHECAERNVIFKPFFLASSPDMVDNTLKFFVQKIYLQLPEILC